MSAHKPDNPHDDMLAQLIKIEWSQTGGHEMRL